MTLLRHIPFILLFLLGCKLFNQDMFTDQNGLMLFVIIFGVFGGLAGLISDFYSMKTKHTEHEYRLFISLLVIGSAIIILIPLTFTVSYIIITVLCLLSCIPNAQQKFTVKK